MYVCTYIRMCVCIYVYICVYKINNFAYFFAHSARERQKIYVYHITLRITNYKLHIIIANARIRGTSRLNGQF